LPKVGALLLRFIEVDPCRAEIVQDAPPVGLVMSAGSEGGDSPLLGYQGHFTESSLQASWKKVAFSGFGVEEESFEQGNRSFVHRSAWGIVHEEVAQSTCHRFESDERAVTFTQQQPTGCAVDGSSDGQECPGSL
jgi:hypothetical protein